MAHRRRSSDDRWLTGGGLQMIDGSQEEVFR